jgi:hypothetical protein
MKTAFKAFMCGYSRLMATLAFVAICVGGLLWLATTEQGYQILWRFLSLMSAWEPWIYSVGLVLTIFVLIPMALAEADYDESDSKETREQIDRYIRNLNPSPGQELCSCRRSSYLHLRRWW